jgi:hypothetical protein
MAQQSYDFLLAQTAYVPEPGEYSFASTQDYSDDDADREWQIEPSFLVRLTDSWGIEVHSHFEQPRGESFSYSSSSVTSVNRWTPRYSRFSLGSAFEYEYADSREESNKWRATAIAGYVRQGWRTVFNLEAEHPMGESTRWQFALGARRRISERVAVGAETRGTLNSGSGTEGLLALYASPLPALSFNFGVGMDFDSDKDLIFHSAIVYRIW